MRITFFFNDTATTEIYTLSLHDALPISPRRAWGAVPVRFQFSVPEPKRTALVESLARSEEHTSELQSHHDLVCRLLLEKKKHTKANNHTTEPQQSKTSYTTQPNAHHHQS